MVLESFDSNIIRFGKVISFGLTNVLFVGKSNFSEQFRNLINRYKRIGYNPYVMRHIAYLVINPTSIDSYASLFNCTTVGRASDSMKAST